jgi:hypothetical protein
MIKVIENTLSQNDLEAIRNIIGHKNIDWNITSDIDFNAKGIRAIVDKNSKQTYQITHVFFKENKLRFEKYRFIYDLMKNIFEQNGCYGKIHRIKTNILFNNFKIKEDEYNIPHSDCEGEHYNMILYLNESDGDTIYFNEYYNENLKNLTINQKVSPKVNRAVISDGVMHTSKNPIKNEIRVVLNAVLKKTINKFNKVC